MEGIAPLVNGRRYSFASIEIAAKLGATGQELFFDVDDITYSESIAFEFKNGTARVPVGSTSGVWQPQEGSLQMGKSTAQKMIQKIGPGWLGINIIMLVSYFDIGEQVTVDMINGRLSGIEDAHSHGPAALSALVKFMPTSPILRNGISGMLNRVF